MSDKVIYVLNSGQNGGIGIGNGVTELPNTYANRNTPFQNNLAFSNVSVNPAIKVVGVHNENQTLSKTTSVNCFEIRKKPSYLPCGVSPKRGLQLAFDDGNPNLNSLILTNPVNGLHTLTVTTNGDGVGASILCNIANSTPTFGVVAIGDGYAEGDTITLTNSNWSQGNANFSVSYVLKADDLNNLPHFDETAYNENQVAGNSAHVLNRVFPRTTSISDYLTNQENTTSYRIKCYDGAYPSGQIFNPNDFDTYDYFVVINPDIVVDSNSAQTKIRTHFAKIKEITSFDEQGDSFEFEPKFSSNIPMGTKFEIWRGPRKDDTDVVALSYGLRGNSVASDTTIENFVTDKYDVFNKVSRPTFYFYKDRLDEKDRLNYNTKYILTSSRWWDNYTLTGKTLAGSGTANFTSQIVNTNGSWTYQPIVGQSLLQASTTGSYRWIGNVTNVNNVGSAPITIAHGMHRIKITDPIYIGSSHYHTVFKTKTEHENKIIDSSRLTVHANLIDNHKIGDETTTPTELLHPNTGGNIVNTYTFDNILWSHAFRNKHRQLYDRNSALDTHYLYKDGTTNANFNANNPLHTDTIFNDDWSWKLSGNFIGDDTYADYSFSPEKTNKIPNATSMELKESTNQVSSLLSLEILDAEGIMSEKVKESAKIRLRQELSSHTMGITKLNGTVTTISTTSNTLTINGISHTLSNIFNSGDTIIVGDYYYIINSIGSLVSSSQTITVSAYRHKDSNMFTNTAQVAFKHIDADLSCYSYFNNRIFGIGTVENTFDYTYNLPLLSGNYTKKENIKLHNTKILSRDGNFSGKRIDIDFGDKSYKYIVPRNHTVKLYHPTSTNLFNYFGGSFVLENEIFNGIVENKNYITNSGMRSLKLDARNDFNNLFGIEISKSLSFSEDFIYSTLTQFADLTYTPSNSFESQNLDYTVSSYNNGLGAGSNYTFTVPYTVGKNIINSNLIVFNSNKYFIGIVNQVGQIDFVNSTQTFKFNEKPLIEPTNGDTIYIVSYTNLYGILGKAIESEIKGDNYSTTLEGSSEKGIIFDSGRELNATGQDFATLVGSSASGRLKDKGYAIFHPRGMVNLEDGEFAFRMGKQDYSRSSIRNVLTKSATQKLPIVKITKTGEETSAITVAAVSPIVLGRVEENTSDNLYPNSNGLYLLNTQGLYDGGIIHRLSSRTANQPITKVTANIPEIFRYVGLEKGESGFLEREETVKIGTDVMTKNKGGDNVYAEIGNTGINAYARVYLSKSDFTLVNPTFDLDNTPVHGSNFADATHPNTNTYFHPLTIPNLDPNVSYYEVAGNANGSVEIDGPVKMLKERWIISDPTCVTYDLFSMGSLLPNSYNNLDNLLDGTTDLTKYSAIVTNESITNKGISSTQHSNYNGNSTRKEKTDKDYAALKISSARNTKPDRFSLIRLVEDTYDWHFNPFNPLNSCLFGQNLIEKSGYGSNKRWAYSMWSSKACSLTTGFTCSLNGTTIATSHNLIADHELEVGDLFYKSDGTYIGIISAIDLSQDEITLGSGAKIALAGNETVRIIQRGHADYPRLMLFDIYGSNTNKGLADHSIDRNYKMNFTRTLHINDKVSKDYMFPENLKGRNKTLIGPIFHPSHSGGHIRTPPNRPSEWFSADINDSTLSTDNFYYHPSRLLNHICHRDENAFGIGANNQNAYRYCATLFLNPKAPFKQKRLIRGKNSGMTSTVTQGTYPQSQNNDAADEFIGDYWGTDAGDNKSSARIRLSDGFGNNHLSGIEDFIADPASMTVAGLQRGGVIGMVSHFGASLLAADETYDSVTNTGATLSADMVFKPQIYVGGSGVTVNNNTNQITINTVNNDANLQWINYTPNLKGRFLVGNKGKLPNENTISHLPSDTNNLYSEVESDSGIEPTYIGQITSHVVNSGVHTLTLDKSWGTVSTDIGLLFRLMRIEPKTLDKRRRWVSLYTMNRFNVLNYTDQDGKTNLLHTPSSLDFNTTLKRDNEGLFELYVIASNDQTFSAQESKWTIIRDVADLSFMSGLSLGQQQRTELYITDGQNSELNNVAIRVDSTGREKIMIFGGNLKNDYYGAVSFGETFIINTSSSPNIENPSHVIIAPEINICSEVSQVTEELLEENGISYSIENVAKINTNLLIESKYYSSSPASSYIIINSLLIDVESKLKYGDTLYADNVVLGKIHSIQAYNTTKTKINLHKMLSIPSVGSILTHYNINSYFISGKLEGDDLLSAVNYLNTYKDITTTAKSGIINFNAGKERPASKANLSYRNSDIYVENTENTKSIFNYANKVIVYGDGLKVTAERQQKGKKTKTITYFNDNIKRKSDAKTKAEELLDLHSNSRDKIRIKLHKTNLEFLSAGDIITLNFPQQEIPKDDYIVFEIKTTFTDTTELSIVSYEKTIAERFAELNVAEKKNATKLFNKNINSSQDIKRGYSEYNLTELSLTVRHNVVTGNNALSWSALMGFNKTFGLQTINGTDVVIDLIEE